MKPYTEETERRYAAVEAQKLGWGGTDYIARLLLTDVKTISQGLLDLKEPLDPAGKRIRKQGDGRKPIINAMPEFGKFF